MYHPLQQISSDSKSDIITNQSHRNVFLITKQKGALAQWLEPASGNRVGVGSNPTISFTPHCQCLSEETLKAIGPFYMVSMQGEVKDPTQGVNV